MYKYSSTAHYFNVQYTNPHPQFTDHSSLITKKNETDIRCRSRFYFRKGLRKPYFLIILWTDVPFSVVSFTV